MYLLENVSSDTTSTPQMLLDNAGFQFKIYGDNFGGGSVSLQVSSNPSDANSWIVLDYQGVTSFGSNITFASMRFAPYTYIQAAFSGSSGAQNVNVEMG